MIAPLVVAGLVAGGIALAGMAKGAYDSYSNSKKADKFIKNLRKNQPPIDSNAFNLPTQNQAKFDKMAMDAQNRAAARMNYANIDKRPQEQFRQGQVDLMKQLQDRAAGKMPSAAELTLQKALGQNIAAARSAAVSAEGVSPAMALKAQLGAQTSANIESGQQAAVTRAQEQAAAEGRLAEVMSGARGQDIGLATSQAGMEQQANLANLQSNIEQRKMNDQLTEFYMQQGFDRDKAQMMASMAEQELIQQSYLGREQIAAGVKSASMGAGAQTSGAMIGAGGSILGGALMGYMMSSSDKNVKTEIKSARKDIDELMKGLKAYSYKYKGQYAMAHKEERISPMAQDLEKSKLGKLLVDKDVFGNRRIDYGKGFGTLASAIGRLNERLQKIEKNKK